jgi:hypothetical protein
MPDSIAENASHSSSKFPLYLGVEERGQEARSGGNTGYH